MHREGFDCTETIKFDVILLSYELASKEADCLSRLNWKVIVIDEAHRLKSGGGRLVTSMQRYTTDFKLLLTGTPIQNTMEELFHLLEYLDSQEFCDKEDFLAKFENISQKEQVLKLHALLAERMLQRLRG